MTYEEVEKFVTQLKDVQRDESHGYVLFFVGDDHLLPFVSLANSDQEFDNVSQLSRPGVFRINIGVSYNTYQGLIGEPSSEPIDYSVLNVFLPHPHYSQYNFICIINPAGNNIARTKQLINEAHSIAITRRERAQRVISQQPKPIE